MNLPHGCSASRGDEIRRWLDAAGDESTAQAIDAIHEEIEATIVLHRPRCDSSGRCCRFEEYGHRLYVTGLESALVIRRAVGDAAYAPEQHSLRDPAQDDADPRIGPGCPFQIRALCGIHADRPAACRVYFCDTRWTSNMSVVAERAVGAIRRLHEELDVSYCYAEWRSLLNAFARELTITITPPEYGAPKESRLIGIRLDASLRARD